MEPASAASSWLSLEPSWPLSCSGTLTESEAIRPAPESNRGDAPSGLGLVEEVRRHERKNVRVVAEIAGNGDVVADLRVGIVLGECLAKAECRRVDCLA